MANMSYCRFQNTLRDLRDCEQLEGMWEPDGLSEEEQKARLSLIEVCKEIASEFEDEVINEPTQVIVTLKERDALADAVELLRQELAWRVGDTDMGPPAWDLQQALARLDALT